MTWDQHMARLYAPFVPTPDAVSHAMLSSAGCGTSDTVVDLGCGDARLLLAALSHPFKAKAAVGVDLDEGLLLQAKEIGDKLATSCGKLALSVAIRTFRYDVTELDGNRLIAHQWFVSDVFLYLMRTRTKSDYQLKQKTHILNASELMPRS